MLLACVRCGSGDRITRSLLVLLLVGVSLGVGAPALRAQTLGPELLRQMAVMDAEKAQRTPAQRKLDSQLVFALKRQRNDPMLAAMPELRIGVEMRDDGATLVDLKGSVTPDLLRFIRRSGGTVLSSHPGLGRLRAWIPVARLESLAARQDVRWVEPPALFETRAVSMGDSAHIADGARSAFNVDGSGVKICVISDGVARLAELQARGELPAVDVLQQGMPFRTEGTAMLEIIRDLAPGAQLGFATGDFDIGTLVTNIRNLRFQARCDVIVDDVAYDESPAFQDGDIARAVNAVTDDGAVYVTAAGNSGGVGRGIVLAPAPPGSAAVYENDFRAVLASNGQAFVVANDFGGGVATNRVVEDAASFILEWAEPLGRATTDFDLVLLQQNANQTLSIVAMSSSIQSGTQDPRERILSGDSSTDRDDQGTLLMVTRKSGTDTRFIRLSAFGAGVRGLPGRIAIGTRGTITGQQGSPRAITVAAAFAGDQNGFFPLKAVETSSAEGPRRIFFRTDGSALTPGNFSSTGGVVIPKPDVVGADGVATFTFDDPLSPEVGLFFGTSASAAHIAAIAGLALSAVPPDAPAAVRQRLRANMGEILMRTARPLASGAPTDMGAGVADARAIVQLARAGLPCFDTRDNDTDGRIDGADPGCASIASLTESPACNDGVDNDQDGLVDVRDTDCSAPSDGTECGIGSAQSLAIVPLLTYLGRRKRTRA